ncbi:hypothetical protein KBI51_08865 [Aerococcaceae bacterium zg-ZUI334]|uniref:hypothetical protein n=1 Tax=Aerococcaceae bacterium zg-252 TaxID=2796928 RepID=UPI001BA1CB37|nr:hypothetical protein [Aerococcaceae bacterium zg-ZUI334]MBS4462773.1 hypothetical protein [Aerococcaceae bacterium zg-B36]
MLNNDKQLIDKDGNDSHHYRKVVLIIIIWSVFLTVILGFTLVHFPDKFIQSIIIYALLVALSGIAIMLIDTINQHHLMIKQFLQPMNDFVHTYQQNHDAQQLMEGLLSLSHLEPGNKAWAVWKLNFATVLIDTGEMERAEAFLVSIIGLNAELDAHVQVQMERLK